MQLPSSLRAPALVTATALGLVVPGQIVSALLPEPRAPRTVSPGEIDRLEPVGSATPTFSWTLDTGAFGYEIAVYPLPSDDTPAGGEALEASLRLSLPAGSGSWTPALDEALDPGDYAWVVRPHDGSGEAGPWSRPSLFRVPDAAASSPNPGAASAPSTTVNPARRSIRPADASREAEKADRRTPSEPEEHQRTARAAGFATLNVNGRINAKDFTGDGSTLANVATDAELAAHANDTRLHTTCDGARCDGKFFTDVRAVAGDSATAFFSTGTIDEARIDPTIARDAEVEALLGGETLVRVAATGTPAENGAALQAAVASILDASSTKRYTVRIGPGIFDVGEDGLTLGPFISLQGTSVSSTIVTAPGDSTPTATSATLILDDDATVEQLTVRNTGGVGTEAFGVRGVGIGWRLERMRIEIEDHGATVASGFDSADLSGVFYNLTGQLVDVDIVVDNGTGIGSSGFGDLLSLSVRRCTITVTRAGAGIADPHMTTGTGSEILVEDTTIRVLGGGVGISVAIPSRQLYRNVRIEVSGGGPDVDNAGLGSNSSLFRPVLENCYVRVRGNLNAAGIRAATGYVTVRGSTLDAVHGVEGVGSGNIGAGFAIQRSTLLGNYGFVLDSTEKVIPHRTFLDHSSTNGVFAFRTTGTGEPSEIRVASSKIDASSSTLQEVTSGSADLKCIDSYDENYDPLGTVCS